MNVKVIVFKALKILFFLAGFPLMVMLMIITMAPMFDAEVTGTHAQNWIIVYTVIGVILLIIHFLLDRFIGAKGRTHRKLVLAVMSALSILSIMMPVACYDAVNKPKYERAQDQLVGEVNVKDYNAVQGWHRDFTARYDSEVYALINAHYDFCKTYGLQSTESVWYGNADKEHNLGYKYGSFEKAEKLVADKLEAKANLEKVQAELATIEQAIEVKSDALALAKEALEADPENAQLQANVASAQGEYDQILADYDDDLVRLKGQRVNIANYKSELVEILLTAVKDETLLPDGLTIRLIGIDIPVGDLLSTVMGIAGGFLNEETINGLIPDVIYTGIGPETVSTYQKAVDGSDGDVSLAEAQRLDFMFKYYPSALASGAVKYIVYVCVGIVVFSIFATDYFATKQKEAENAENKNEEDLKNA